MKNWILLISFLTSASCSPSKPKAITQGELVGLGFTRMNERPPIFRSEGRTGAFADLLGFKIADLRPVPGQPMDSDIREGLLRGAYLTVTTKVVGEFASRSLNQPETPCIIEVQFRQ